MKKIIKRYRVRQNKAWTTQILFDKCFMSKRHAEKAMKKIHKSDGSVVTSLLYN